VLHNNTAPLPRRVPWHWINVAVFVGDHGSAAQMVGMVEVEGWRSVGCGLGDQKSGRDSISWG